MYCFVLILHVILLHQTSQQGEISHFRTLFKAFETFHPKIYLGTYVLLLWYQVNMGMKSTSKPPSRALSTQLHPRISPFAFLSMIAPVSIHSSLSPVHTCMCSEPWPRVMNFTPGSHHLHSSAWLPQCWFIVVFPQYIHVCRISGCTVLYWSFMSFFSIKPVFPQFAFLSMLPHLSSSLLCT